MTTPCTPKATGRARRPAKVSSRPLPANRAGKPGWGHEEWEGWQQWGDEHWSGGWSSSCGASRDWTRPRAQEVIPPKPVQSLPPWRSRTRSPRQTSTPSKQPRSRQWPGQSALWCPSWPHPNLSTGGTWPFPGTPSYAPLGRGDGGTPPEGEVHTRSTSGGMHIWRNEPSGVGRMGATIRSTAKARRSWAGSPGTSTWRVNLRQTWGQESKASAKSSHSKWLGILEAYL